MDHGIACTYCGGWHESAAQVRQCWAALERTDDPGAPWQLALGRSVLVSPGQAPPPAWRGCERAGTGTSTEDLEQAWRQRVPLVVEVEEPGGGTRPAADEVERRPVWSLAPSFSFPLERRQHALATNSVDARHERPGPARGPNWWLAEEAVRLGARAAGPADVVLPDGRPAVCDGGPLTWSAPLRTGPVEAVVVPRVNLLAGTLAPFGPNQYPGQLAADQLAAVTHSGGGARIIAPAGSGKTRVLTERARHLLCHWSIPGRAVTLVAFNKRAADEMRERTPDLPQLRVRTLNALGLSLVSGTEEVATIDERQVRSIISSLVDMPRRLNSDPTAAWIDALGLVRLGLRSPSEVEAEMGGDVDGLPEVFDRYRRVLADRHQLDFDEQVYRAIEILLADPRARGRARDACRVLLVDEFQDLTPAHLLLIRILAGPDGAVFGVGDDDQTIYGYSGATPEWLIRFSRFFPAAGEHALEVNYRCPPKVVTAAGALLRHNRDRVPKRIASAPGRLPQETDLTVVDAGDDALGATVSAVEKLLSGGAAPQDVAVLTRVNASLAGVQVALAHRGAPVQPAVGTAWLARSGTEAALAWLRLATAPADRLAGRDLAVAAKRPPRALAPRVLEWMSEQRSLPRLQALAQRLDPRAAEKVSSLLEDLHRLRRLAISATAVEVLRAVRDDIGLSQAVQVLDGSRRRLEGGRSAQSDDLDALVALAALHPEPMGFEDWLRESLSRPGSPGGVLLSTIHRVKGREWPHVVLHEVTGGLFPHRLAQDLEEERRVFHVGLTRCSVSACVVTGDPPSPFVAEMFGTAPTKAPSSRKPAGTPRSPAAKSRRAPGAVAQARDSLKAWRSAKAARERKPAYIFLHDRVLEAIAEKLPTDLSALARVPGIGPAKLEAFGDELLAVVAGAIEAGGEG